MKAILVLYDQSMLLMFLGVVSFALNWYAWPRAHWVMERVAIISSLAVIGIELVAHI